MSTRYHRYISRLIIVSILVVVAGFAVLTLSNVYAAHITKDSWIDATVEGNEELLERSREPTPDYRKTEDIRHTETISKPNNRAKLRQQDVDETNSSQQFQSAPVNLIEATVESDPAATEPGVAEPDLVITELSWEPANPVAGETVVFHATITNHGNGATPAETPNGVGFWVDNHFVAWSDNNIDSLQPGQTITVTANGTLQGTNGWIAAAGAYKLGAFVDDVNRIQESDEQNNMHTVALTVGEADTPAPIGQPDLVIDEVGWEPSNPQNLNEGFFWATITNRGSGVTPAGVIHGAAFRVNGELVNWSDTNTESIPPGGSATLIASGGPSSSSVWSGVAGSYVLEAHVDDVNRIAESDDANNMLVVSLEIGGR